ncbi:MAG: hypothetical protein AAFP79_04600 [Pseudomonadota bacterium]
MTLDQLIFNYELAKANAARSASLEDRKTYFDLVGYYERRIRAVRTEAVPSWTGISRGQLPSERLQ